MKTINFNFGDIILINFPFSDFSDFKKRPCLVLCKNKEDYLVLFITSNQKFKEKYDIVLEKNSINNLASDSLIKVCKASTIHENQIYKKIGVIDKKIGNYLKQNLISLVNNL